LQRKKKIIYLFLWGGGGGRAGSPWGTIFELLLLLLLHHYCLGRSPGRRCTPGSCFVCFLSLALSLSLATTKLKRKESKQAKHTHAQGEITSLQAFAPCSSSITKSLTKFLGALYLLTSRLKMIAKFWMSQPEEV
jgi:hypothetical protein